ncbi:unnamed protein product [Porites evermanni]|uniref:Ribosomal protein L32 n=1 Tax=Porites evermanni TaxID=104178 RepID=A0ABN8LTI1_9CNID|nr:unnamed protein product [Porites evermanni]
MSFFVNKGDASRSELPINNLSQQLGKFRKEKSKPNTVRSNPGLITTKQKSQNQGKLFNFFSKKNPKKQVRV